MQAYLYYFTLPLSLSFNYMGTEDKTSMRVKVSLTPVLLMLLVGQRDLLTYIVSSCGVVLLVSN